MTSLPQSPEQLLEALFSIFPAYRTAYDGPIHDEAPTFHSVLLAFTPFFGAGISAFPVAELRSFGSLVSEAIAQAGPLENAFGTCLLEHLHQIHAKHELWPYLSPLARALTHA